MQNCIRTFPCTLLILDYQGFDRFHRVIPLKKRCRILLAGGMGVPHSFRSPPKIRGYRGLIESISVVSEYSGRIPLTSAKEFGSDCFSHFLGYEYRTGYANYDTPLGQAKRHCVEGSLHEWNIYHCHLQQDSYAYCEYHVTVAEDTQLEYSVFVRASIKCP